MKFSMDPNKTQYFVDGLAGTLDLAAQRITAAIESLDEIAKKQQYKPLLDAVGQLKNDYQGKFVDEVNKAYEDWLKTDSSVENYIARLKAGDASMTAARELQDRIKDAIDNAMPKDLQSSSDDLVDLQKTLEEILDEIIEVAIKLETELNNIFDMAFEEGSFDEATSAENEVANCVVALLETLRTVYQEFAKGVTEAMNKVAEGVKEMAQAAADRSEEAAVELKAQTAASLQDMALDFIKFKD